MNKKAAALALGVLLGMTVSVPALADPHGDNHWHGDIHHFHEYDMNRWRGGHWSVSPHDGRHGWWWIVGGEWYYYPVPVYPYPDPFVPPTVVVQQPAQVQTSYWYCQNPPGYYPYVAGCFVQWQSVPEAVQAQTQPAAPPSVEEPVPQESQRDADDRMLDTFAAEFYKTDTTHKDAAEHLQNLLGRIETFREALFDRKYNAMDILHDTENLEKRIARKKAEIATRS